MLDSYRQAVAERLTLGIPPLSLTAAQTRQLCQLLLAPPDGEADFLLQLLAQRVPSGVDDAAKVKAEFLDGVATGALACPLLSATEAVALLGAMQGGYNVEPLLRALRNEKLAAAATAALASMVLVYDGFEQVAALSGDCPAAAAVLRSWAEAGWFTSRPELPGLLRLKLFRVEGEINTDDFSPAGEAWSRADIPLHALSMGRSRFPGGIAEIARWRAEGHRVAFVGDVVGTGSSRKSAINSLLWHIGEDIPGIPNKRRDGVILGGAIAPIFFNTAQDSGGLPIEADVSTLTHGAEIDLDLAQGEIRTVAGEVLSRFSLRPATLADEYRAGGRIPLIIGKALTARARAHLGLPQSTLFAAVQNPVPAADQGYSLAQKLVGRACGLPGVLPGTACEPRMTTVGSQDTTGPMTAAELAELACLRFLAPLVMQSFCHTSAYPKAPDIVMHRILPPFIAARGGVALQPGDGVIHSWLNRLLLPDTVGTGGDSHTRFPLGISFPAGSGLVAFAAAQGFMPLDMPESVLVRFTGSLRPGITLRDLVNAIPYFAIQRGLLTVPKKSKLNVFNGRILEMEGLPELTVEQAFELTDAAAERSAAAACIALSEARVAEFLRSNLALLRYLIASGYRDAATLERRAQAIEAWLAEPQLLRADAQAQYAAVLEIDLDQIVEPIVACPNDPDDVRPLSAIAGATVDDVFIGSCMTNIGHFRAAARLWQGARFNPAVRTWICPPTRMDQDQLRREGAFAAFAAIGARIEPPGCSLCMGNQARVPAGATVFSTSTRNFDDRMGDGAKVYLGSAELAAMAAVDGRIPSVNDYFQRYAATITPDANRIYRSLQFDGMDVL